MMNKGGGSYSAKFTGTQQSAENNRLEQLGRKRHGPGQSKIRGAGRGFHRQALQL